MRRLADGVAPRRRAQRDARISVTRERRGDVPRARARGLDPGPLFVERACVGRVRPRARATPTCADVVCLCLRAEIPRSQSDRHQRRRPAATALRRCGSMRDAIAASRAARFRPGSCALNACPTAPTHLAHEAQGNRVRRARPAEPVYEPLQRHVDDGPRRRGDHSGKICMLIHSGMRLRLPCANLNSGTSILARDPPRSAH